MTTIEQKLPISTSCAPPGSNPRIEPVDQRAFRSENGRCRKNRGAGHVNVREVVNSKYKRRLYLRYLGVSLFPFLFFVLLGSGSIFFSQRYVSEELSLLSFRNLNQVRDTFELVLSETDAFALSLATDPGFNQNARQLLEKEVKTLEDSKLYKNFMDGLITATNVRRYLHSLYIFNKYVPGKLITNSESILDVSRFYDTGWLSELKDRKDEMRFWLSRRSVLLFTSSPVSREVITLYRNILEPYALESQGIIVVNIKLEYLESLLRSISNTGDQDFIVYHPSIGPLVDTSAGGKLPKDVLDVFTRRAETGKAVGSVFFMTKDGRQFAVSCLESSRYPLFYFSMVPKDTYYHLSYKLLGLTVAFSFFALVLGIVTMVYFTRRSFGNIEYICDTIEAAEKGLSVSSVQKEAAEDSFYELTHEIVRTFLERNYLKLREKTLELQALQAQMNPHFLFNTLTAISLRAMGYTGGPNDVTKIVDLLSRILDYSLETQRKDVTFKDEVQFTRYYLEIQSFRYPGRFRTRWEVEREAMDCKVIKLLLQPLVENSVQHGVDPESKKTLSIVVRGERKDGFLLISIEDDGAGMTDERLAEVLKMIEEAPSADHIGLVNTVRRLRLLFGDQVGLEIRSVKGKGTTVALKIPSPERKAPAAERPGG